eukprot:gene32995-39908_t
MPPSKRSNLLVVVLFLYLILLVESIHIEIVIILCSMLHVHQFDSLYLSLLQAHNISYSSNNSASDSQRAHSKNSMHITAFGDQYAVNTISRCADKYPSLIPVTVVPLSDHTNEHVERMRDKRFSCAMYKLNIPAMMPKDVDFALFLDVDIVIYQDITQMYQDTIALAKENKKLLYSALETSNMTTDGQPCSDAGPLKPGKEVVNMWYRTHNKHHYLPPSGLNTGVLVYNLAQMRAENVTPSVLFAFNTEDVLLADQDVLNSWAYYNPSRVGILSCNWNARKDSACYFPVYSDPQNTSSPVREYMNCHNAPDHCGIYHGNGGAFRNKRQMPWLVAPYKDKFEELCGFRLY